MAYSTVAQVKAILIAREGEFNDTASLLNDAQIEFAITSADAEINAALRRKYKVPFGLDGELVPDLVHTLSIDIACYQADLIFRSQTTAPEDSPSVRRYDRARRILNELKTGRIDLDAIENIDLEAMSASVFMDYTNPLFPFAHIFKGGSEYSEGVFPDDRSHY